MPFLSDNFDVGAGMVLCAELVFVDRRLREERHQLHRRRHHAGQNDQRRRSIRPRGQPCGRSPSHPVNGLRRRSGASSWRCSTCSAIAASASRPTPPSSTPTSRTIRRTSRPPALPSPALPTRRTWSASTKSTASRPASPSTGATSISISSASCRTTRSLRRGADLRRREHAGRLQHQLRHHRQRPDLLRGSQSQRRNLQYPWPVQGPDARRARLRAPVHARHSRALLRLTSQLGAAMNVAAPFVLS